MPLWLSGGLAEWAQPTGALPVLSPETAADSQSSVSARVLLVALLAFAVVAAFLVLAFVLPALARLPVSDDTRLQLGALVAALPIVLAIVFLIAG